MGDKTTDADEVAELAQILGKVAPPPRDPPTRREDAMGDFRPRAASTRTAAAQPTKEGEGTPGSAGHANPSTKAQGKAPAAASPAKKKKKLPWRGSGAPAPAPAETPYSKEMKLRRGSLGHSSTTSSSALSHRPAWNNTPLRNTPAYLKGLRILTDEPWKEVSVADMAARMNFGSRESLGLTDDDELFEYNGLVEEARNKRMENAVARPWNASPVKHQPPVLRGQKCVGREEPWSKYHNDNIEELNAIDNSSVTEVYKISENRDNGVKPTLVQPAWDPGWARRTRAQTAALKARRRPSASRDGRGARAPRSLCGKRWRRWRRDNARRREERARRPKVWSRSEDMRRYNAREGM